jgi:histone H3/H4
MSLLLCLFPRGFHRHDSRALVVALLPSTLALRSHGDETQTLFDWRRFCPTYQTAARANGFMSGHSPPETHRAHRASSCKTDKADVYDANIRNFAPVARIMKNALPENAKIAKEAKECMQECVSEFISFITSEGKPCLVSMRRTLLVQAV